MAVVTQNEQEVMGLPPLYGQRGSREPIVYWKYRDDATGACWYICEGSPNRHGTDMGLYGYFKADDEGDWCFIWRSSLEQLCRATGGRIFREDNFSPRPLRELLRQEHGVELRTKRVL